MTIETMIASIETTAFWVNLYPDPDTRSTAGPIKVNTPIYLKGPTHTEVVPKSEFDKLVAMFLEVVEQRNAAFRAFSHIAQTHIDVNNADLAKIINSTKQSEE